MKLSVNERVVKIRELGKETLVNASGISRKNRLITSRLSMNYVSVRSVSFINMIWYALSGDNAVGIESSFATE